jgi:hypothetical protein
MAAPSATLTQASARERAQLIGSVDYVVELDLTGGDQLLSFDARIDFK